MIECQCLCACLDRKDFSFLRLNDIDEKYFPNYSEEYKYIEDHVKTYGQVPDLATFIEKFPQFTLVDVKETDKYLIDSVRENYVFNSSVTILKDVEKKFKSSDSREAVAYLLSKMPELNKKLTFEATDLISNFEERYKKYEETSKNQEKSFIKLGIPELDEIIGGLDACDENAILTASTGQGKSWWAIFIGLSAAKQGLKVGYYSGEMPKYLVGFRIDTAFGHISNFALTRGNSYVRDEYRHILERLRKEVPGSFYCATPDDFGGAPTVSKLNAFIEKYSLDLLIIDQYSLLEDTGHSKKRDEQFANLSRDIKLMQTMKKIPVLSVVQLNRGASSKDVENPDTSHVSGSNRISEDATLAISIKQKQDNILELRIMKGRNCKTGSKLTYNWAIDTFELVYLKTEDDAYSIHKECMKKNGINVKEDPTEKEVYKDNYEGTNPF